MMSATYCPTENKLRLYSSTRLDEETYQRVKAAGFRWAPKQDCFFAPAWTPEREDLLLELCGDIGDEDTSLVERAEDRAERFEEYHDKRLSEAEAAHKAVAAIADGIPLGQKILVGHHSEKRARKDAERIRSGMARAVNLWQTSRYWEARAEAALRHAKYKERPEVRARRIKGLEADIRRCKAAYTPKDPEQIILQQAWTSGPYNPDAPKVPHVWCSNGSRGGSWVDVSTLPALEAHYARWIAHYELRLAYERAMLADAGGTVADRTGPEVGGAARCWVSHHGGWSTIQKVNKVSVTVLDNWGHGGGNFTRTVPFDKLAEVLTKAQVERLRADGKIVDHPDGTGFFRASRPAPAPEPPAAAPDAAPFEAMRDTLKAGIKTVVVDQLFPTPPELAARMVALADLQDGERILEPSAGTGQLLGLVTHGPARVEAVAIERNPELAGVLRAQQARGAYPGTDIRCADFLECVDEQGFDVILMNPPFDRGADVHHVTHALDLLRPGGRLVAVMAAGMTFNTSKAYAALRARLEADNATIEPLPPDTFKAAGTSVNTVLVTLTRPAVEGPYPTPKTLGEILCNVMVETAVEMRQAIPTPAPPSLSDLAASLDTTCTKDQGQRTRERLELEARGKLAPRKPQAAPEGLFAQEQGRLL